MTINLPQTVVVVTDPADWPDPPADVAVVAAKDYLTHAAWAERRGVRVINLCRSYRYQRSGYYVSMLALARGHRPMPTLEAIQDVKSKTVTRMFGEDLGELMQERLAHETGSEVVLQLYFGVDMLGRHPELSRAIFARAPLPLLRAVLRRSERDDRWALASLGSLSLQDVPPEHGEVLGKALQAFLRRRKPVVRSDVNPYDLAILVDPREEHPPSNPEALAAFAAAGQAEGFSVEFVGKEDYSRVAEFDALFIRETTAVNHRTFRFAQRASKEGLEVIDDPQSILRCTNKVFLAEALGRRGIPIPRTLIAHRGNLAQVRESIGLPLVLKQPDSSFSQGVMKVHTDAEFTEATRELLRRSELVVAQAFTPTDYDWRIGVLGGKALYACKYFMARRHWQIIHRDENTGATEDGATEAVPLEQVPEAVLGTAVRAAAVMGQSLYGVDLKETPRGVFVIEVNDNPSIDAGYEDALLGEALYRSIMSEFRRRLDRRHDRVPT